MKHVMIEEVERRIDLNTILLFEQCQGDKGPSGPRNLTTTVYIPIAEIKVAPGMLCTWRRVARGIQITVIVCERLSLDLFL